MKIKLKQKILVTTFAFVCATTPVFAQEAIYAVADGKLNASELTYDFYDDSLYCINVKVGHVTDIILHQGENFISAIGGDTKQWMIDKARVGNVTHIYIKPLVNSARTDIIINTNKRSYHFLVTATDYYNPIVSFNFPEEIAAQKKAEIKKLNEPTKEEKEFMTIFTESKNGEVVLKDMNYKYKIKANNKRLAEDICPKKVFDDGVRTYIEMPKNRYDLPVLYNVDVLDNKKLTLVNYRIKGKYYIADRVFNHARLQYTSKLYVDIYLVEEEGDKK